MVRTGAKIVKKWTEAGFSITYRDDRKRFQVRLTQVGGQRRFKMLETLTEARQFCREERARVTNEGTASFNLSGAQRVDAARALEILGSVSLSTAAEFYRAHHPASGTISLSDAVQEYLLAPGRRGKKAVIRRPHTVEGLRRRLSVFVSAFLGRELHQITTQDIESWLDRSGWRDLNRKHYLAAVRALYQYAYRQGYVAHNPADAIESVEAPHVDPAILSPEDQCREPLGTHRRRRRQGPGPPSERGPYGQRRRVDTDVPEQIGPGVALQVERNPRAQAEETGCPRRNPPTRPRRAACVRELPPGHARKRTEDRRAVGTR